MFSNHFIPFTRLSLPQLYFMLIVCALFICFTIIRLLNKPGRFSFSQCFHVIKVVFIIIYVVLPYDHNYSEILEEEFIYYCLCMCDRSFSPYVVIIGKKRYLFLPVCLRHPIILPLHFLLWGIHSKQSKNNLFSSQMETIFIFRCSGAWHNRCYSSLFCHKSTLG